MLDNSKDHIKHYIEREGIKKAHSTAMLPSRSNKSNLSQDSNQKLNINDILYTHFVK
jgi:hypothetical protein